MSPDMQRGSRTAWEKLSPAKKGTLRDKQPKGSARFSATGTRISRSDLGVQEITPDRTEADQLRTKIIELRSGNVNNVETRRQLLEAYVRLRKVGSSVFCAIFGCHCH